MSRVVELVLSCSSTPVCHLRAFIYLQVSPTRCLGHKLMSYAMLHLQVPKASVVLSLVSYPTKLSVEVEAEAKDAGAEPDPMACLPVLDVLLCVLGKVLNFPEPPSVSVSEDNRQHNSETYCGIRVNVGKVLYGAWHVESACVCVYTYVYVHHCCHGLCLNNWFPWEERQRGPCRPTFWSLVMFPGPGPSSSY